MVSRLALPPLFLHFAMVFPDRPHPWVGTDAGRATVPAFYIPAVLLGGSRVTLMLSGLHGPQSTQMLERIEQLEYLYLSACLLGGLVLMVRALSRCGRSRHAANFAGSCGDRAIGVLPFVVTYAFLRSSGRAVPFADTRPCCSAVFRWLLRRRSSGIA